MKLKKILAAVAAAAIAVSAMAISAFASEPVNGAPGWKPIPILGSDVTVPDSIYGPGVEVTFNITVKDINGGWNNGSAGILAGEDIVGEAKFGGTACDADGNRSWFPAGSVVIGDSDKTATIVCKADLTGKSNFNVYIFSTDKDGDSGAFALDSITIKNAAGFEAKYADGKFEVTAGGDAAAPADDAAAPADEETAAPAEDEAEAEDEDVDVETEEEEDEPEAEETAVAETEAAPVEEAPAPAVENATAAPATGNTAVATVVAVMAVAGAAAIVSKKRK